jgi:O-antigen ligase
LPVTVKRESRRLVRRVWWAALSLAVLLIVIMTAIGGIAPAGFVDMVASGFRFNSDAVAMSRRDQFMALVNGWLQHPAFGSGHGAPAPGVIRSIEMPWSYELTYVALLYHTGIVGLVAYGAGLGWIFLKARRIAATGWSQAPYLVATLVGTASFVLANATNPYLEKYDSIWVVFMPIAFINLWLTETRRARA